MEVVHHSSAFLLPPDAADHRPSLSYALVVLNQRLPRFTPLLWQHGTLRSPPHPSPSSPPPPHPDLSRSRTVSARSPRGMYWSVTCVLLLFV